MIRRSASVILLLTSLMLSNTASADWALEYGNEKGKVAVFNSKTSKSFAEDAPFGPMSFRVVNNDIWVLDSIGGRLYSFDASKKLKNEIAISGLPDNLMLEDFALNFGSKGAVESFWVADAAECIIRKVSTANGKELVKIGGNGNETGKFLQINQLETDSAGRLYVGDYGRSLICVFTRYGEPVREVPWQSNGFVVDSHGRLHTLVYKEQGGYFYRIHSSQGQIVSSRHIGLPDLLNSRLWGINSAGNLQVSFIPAGGFKGRLKLFEISPDGKIIKQTEISPPSMNRFVEFSDDSFWLAEADYFAAPEGLFQVKSCRWDDKK